MLNKIIKFVSDIFESEETKKQKREEESNLYANAQYKVFKEQLTKDLPFIKISESKNIRKVERQLTATIPNYQADGLKNIHGIDVDTMTENLLRNELTSTIRNEYIDMMFSIGWETHFKIGKETGKTFNFSIDPSDVAKKPKSKKEAEEMVKSTYITHKGYSKEILEIYTDGMLSIERKRFEKSELNYENLSTIQNRLLDNISLAIKELEHKNLPTRQKKYRLFTNMHIATALQDAADFNVNNTILSQQTGQPFKLCSVLNETVEIWVDPIMSAKDNRICISYMDNKILMAAEERIWFNTLPSKDGNKKLMSLTYGIEYLGDFSDCITLVVYMGDMNIT